MKTAIVLVSIQLWSDDEEHEGGVQDKRLMECISDCSEAGNSHRMLGIAVTLEIPISDCSEAGKPEHGMPHRQCIRSAGVCHHR